MKHKSVLFHGLIIIVFLVGWFSPMFSFLAPVKVARAAGSAAPVVGIHVSELTQALETMNAAPPTPAGTGYSGKEWFLTAWHYYVMYESLKIALESDGTPYAIISDADIAAGGLMTDTNSPKYPIVISLASEAIADNEIQPLRDYVSAGGFLFVGSSGFTRNPNGTTRGDFALASEMGLNMVNHNLLNWTSNSSFTRLSNHRLVTHIPSGALTWDMLYTAEDAVWGTSGAQHMWRVTANGAEVVANGGGGLLLATKGYGSGRFIYHSILNPIVGAGGYDSGMYAYTIYRSAIEWAFENANLPIIKRSPWPYIYDAAFMVRHDFENYLSYMTDDGVFETSAAYEASKGVKGDYYFCTGALRTISGDKQPYLDGITDAVGTYGATLGSHNGGFPNVGVTDPNAYEYWHWGPDTMLDRTSGFPDPYGSYTSGYDYSKDSISQSFADIETWLSGIDNGRVGCGAAGNCPRTWVSPYFNSGRDRSFKILDELDSIVMGEQKTSPFPHWTLSYDPTTPNHRYSHLTLPPSDWYVGSGISQSIEGHNTSSIQALVDFYTQKGYLMNLYGHASSTSGNTRTYVDYAVSKTRMWSINSVGLYDWWVRRDPVTVTPSYSKVGMTGIASASISGAVDPQTAIELVIPNWSSGAVGDLVVRLNGSLADPSSYRVTSYGVKVLVGTTVTDVEVRYQPLEAWLQTDWSGGAGQAIWSDPTKYETGDCLNTSVPGQFSLAVATPGDSLFSDNFNRTLPSVPFNWITTGIPDNYGVFNNAGGTLNAGLSAASHYGYAYKDVPTQPAGDYTIEADISFPNPTTGGGIYGRLNPITGTRYAIWIYPPSTLQLIKFTDWVHWSGIGSGVTIPAVGTGWHHLKMVFAGSNIQVFYDNEATPRYNATDTNYTAGYVGLDFWSTSTTNGPKYNNYIVKDSSETLVFSDNFGEDTDPASLLTPWTVYTGGWSVTGNNLRSTASGLSSYANIYYQPAEAWTNYSVQARVQFPSSAFGGGLVGRVNPTTGNRYTAWVYPGTSLLRLIEWNDWDSWSPIAEVNISPVGTDWHTVKMDFTGSHIRVYWDGDLRIDAEDTTSPYMSGGIGLDTYTAGSAYLMAADDVQVIGPAQYATSCALNSSAFDGGFGVDWQTVDWEGSVPASTSVCVRTRTADRSDQLAAAAWSACYPTGSSAVTSLDKRWMQYRVELSTSDNTISPIFTNIRFTYAPGSYLLVSNLSYTGPTSGMSGETVNLIATLRDESNAPLVGRTVSFSLGNLAPVSGVTGADGSASAVLALDIAPGTYLLTAAFTSDGLYQSASASTTFTVTEDWSEIIQDTAPDFIAGSGSEIDTTTTPGSVLLQRQTYGEGEESGSFNLGGNNWSYRRKIIITNPNTSALPAGYTLKLVVDTAALVSANKLLPNGNDLRLVWNGGGAPVEIDRVADTTFNTAATEIRFKSQASILAGSQDNSYYIYYGNAGAGAPPANPANVFAMYDGFDDTVIDTVLWSLIGTVSESGGWARLSTGGNLYGKTTFTYGVLEMRIQAVAEHNYMWWGLEDGVADAPNFMVFEEHQPPTNLAALLRNDNGTWQTLSLSDPAGGLTTPHVYATDWRPGQARWYIDGNSVVSSTSGVPDTPMSVNLNANQQAFNVDWVRTRLAAPQEPTVNLVSTFQGYVSQGVYTSPALNTIGTLEWKYLVWDGLTPAGTSLNLRVRTAQTEAGLADATWVDYPQSGVLITNPVGRWAQYQANFQTTNTDVTPELQKVTLYYIPLGMNTYAEPLENCETNSPCFGSIWEAIDNVRTDGTVYVYAGSYPESVNISDNINLNFWGDATINGYSQSNGTVNMGNHTLTVLSNWSQTGGVVNAGTGTVALAGSGTQTLSAGSAFNRLEIANTGSGVMLNSDVTVNTQLQLTSGLLNIGAYDLILAEAATIGGTPSAASMIVADGAGTVCKQVSSGNPAPFTFPIGDTTGTIDYSPAWIDLSDVNGSGCLSVRLTNAIHPNNPDTPRLTRYWTVTQSGLNAFTADLTFFYVDSDLDLDGKNEVDIRAARYNGSSWSLQGSADAGANTISFTTNAFSDFTGKGASPTAVLLSGLDARIQNGHTRVTWSTASEIGLIGFNVYRSTNPLERGEKLNDTLILGSQSGENIGANYVYIDETAQQGTTYYWIEMITIDGRQLFGPAVRWEEFRIFLPVIGG